jgi:hypothetical protein
VVHCSGGFRLVVASPGFSHCGSRLWSVTSARMSISGSISEDPNPKTGCGSCNEDVVAGEKALQCAWCSRWVHNACCAMPDVYYKMIVKYEKICTGSKWFCKVCEMHFGKTQMEIKIVAERQTLVESKQEIMHTSVSEVKKEVSDLRKEFAEFVKERQKNTESTSLIVDDKIVEIKEEIKEIKKSYSGMVQGAGAVGGAASSSLVSAPARTIQVEVSEVMEREKRKNNLVIFGIEETNDEFATKEKINIIINAVGLDENKVKYFGRVGRQVSGARARIVRVVCEDAETKRSFLKAANRLKSMDGFAGIYIGLDLTKVQQVQDKNLRVKLKEVRDVHKEARINNGEIIVFEDGNRKILYSQQQ